MTQAIYISDQVQQVIELYQPLLTVRTKRSTVYSELNAMSEVLMKAHKSGDPRAKIELSNWHPALVGRSQEEIMNARLALTDFQLTLAREHAFDTWAQVEAWGNVGFNTIFENAIDVMLSGDLEQLNFLIRKHPALIEERSAYNHGATMLHYLGSNGIEIRRQIVPYNLSKLARLLLNAGADPFATAFLYQSQLTTMDLLTSSAHPVDAGVLEETVTVLKTHPKDLKL